MITPIYSLQLAYAVMVLVEMSSYGLGKTWLIISLILFSIFTIINLVLEFINILK